MSVSHLVPVLASPGVFTLLTETTRLFRRCRVCKGRDELSLGLGLDHVALLGPSAVPQAQVHCFQVWRTLQSHDDVFCGDGRLYGRLNEPGKEALVEAIHREAHDIKKPPRLCSAHDVSLLLL